MSVAGRRLQWRWPLKLVFLRSKAQQMNLRSGLVALLVFLVSTSSSAAAASRPNILFILADGKNLDHVEADGKKLSRP